MKSFVTSLNGLFSQQAADVPHVEWIEIPIIQRDYAQGREGERVTRIRENFLLILHEALTIGEPISLDFVFGDITDGVLHPLDGQQRLTTLFLLHWYLAWRAECLDREESWKHFSYATRESAKLFCKRLVGCTPPADVKDVREWLKDQHWFLHTWLHDPTIQSMLVMIQAIHVRFADTDCMAAWQRLVDPETPAVSFHLLPIAQIGLNNDLYIKMNSRGKPLTAFENFKARFEQVVEASCPDRIEEFAKKVDGAWADLLWPYRGSDSIVDDECLSYFHFVTEVCEWRDDQLASGDVAVRAESVYGPGNMAAAAHLNFLFQSFDTWIEPNIPSVFANFFALNPAPLDSDDTSKVVLFGPKGVSTVDLFAACCQSYGQTSGRNRVFSLPQTLFLYAVLLNRIHASSEFPRRLRVLRNLIEASSNELRLEKMPALLADVSRLVVDGALHEISTFNQAQVAEERLKVDMLAEAPALAHQLFHLEDHPVLHGCLAAFEFDAAVFERRARAFHDVFADPSLLPLLTAAHLAAGDYSRSITHRFFKFGSGSNLAPWRDVLAVAGRDNLLATRTRSVLGRLLDAVAESDGDVRSSLESYANQWLESSVVANGLEWRWYFVKYAAMRDGSSGVYAGADGALSYSACMLDKTQMNSWYRDPYLSAIQRESGVGDVIEQRWPGGPWFTGYETEPRWLRLKASGTGVQCVDNGYLLSPPATQAHADAFAQVSTKYGIGADNLLRVPQVVVGECLLDTRDRIQCGAELLRDLVAAGL